MHFSNCYFCWCTFISYSLGWNYQEKHSLMDKCLLCKYAIPLLLWQKRGLKNRAKLSSLNVKKHQHTNCCHSIIKYLRGLAEYITKCDNINTKKICYISVLTVSLFIYLFLFLFLLGVSDIYYVFSLFLCLMTDILPEIG